MYIYTGTGPRYTGVGSRSTPLHILHIMTMLAKYLLNKGYVLRSGGAQGADTAFEQGAGTAKEIFYANDANAECMNIASKIHPAWDRCSDYAKKLHARNVLQVLGKNLDKPSKFLVCWTPGAELKGGTRTAIVLAQQYNIPVLNLGNPRTLEDIKRKIAYKG